MRLTMSLPSWSISRETTPATPLTLRQAKARTNSLERFPDHGRVVPELQALGVRFLRELVLAPSRVLYQIEGGSVHIVAVFDGRRNLEDILLERALRTD